MKLMRPALLAGLALAGVAGAAQARTDVHFSVGLGVPAPVYYAPPPVYYAPPPVYYSRPAPVYYQPYYPAATYVYGPVRHKHKRHHRVRVVAAPVYIY